MSTLVQTYLEFESRESFLQHLTPAYAGAKASGQLPTFLSAVYLKWLRAFPQDALDGINNEDYHGKRALVPTYPPGKAISTCRYLQIAEATLLSVLSVSFGPKKRVIFTNQNIYQESRRIVIEVLEYVPEGILLEQEQRLTDVSLSIMVFFASQSHVVL